MGKFFTRLPVVILSILFCSNTEFQLTSNTATEPAIGSKGIVSSAHPLATQAGLDILAKGGNAFDAAVGIAAALNVVEPMMSGAGGYGTILVYDAENQKARFLNCSSKIPVAVNSDVYRPPTPNYKQNRRGAKAVSTPGNVHAWEAMSKEYGKLDWKDLFETAIKLADEGFLLGDWTAKSIKDAFPSFPEFAQKIYGVNGEPMAEGDRLIQKDLANTLKVIAQQGADNFYNGKIGQAIHRAMKNAGGFLSMEDLKADRAQWWQPIEINYRGFDVITASPPATAFPSLIRLGMMSQFEVKKLGHNSKEFLHRFAEVTKHAFWCRLAHAGDPDLNPPPLDRLLSDDYWKEKTDKINPEKSTPFEYPDIIVPPGENTTHFVVSDRWGNIVCATQTLGNSFGSRIMPAGTGIWLNNSLAYCTFEPKGNPMDAHAGHYKLSGDCPTIIIKDDKAWVAIGTPGGHTIGQTVAQMVMNLIDFDMDIQQAIATPRISFIEPDYLAFESGISEDIINQLTKMGHKIKSRRSLGNAHGLTIEYDKNGKPIKFTGGADPRGHGLAKGY